MAHSVICSMAWTWRTVWHRTKNRAHSMAHGTVHHGENLILQSLNFFPVLHFPPVPTHILTESYFSISFLPYLDSLNFLVFLNFLMLLCILYIQLVLRTSCQIRLLESLGRLFLDYLTFSTYTIKSSVNTVLIEYFATSTKNQFNKTNNF